MGFLAVFLAAKAISGGKLIIEVSYFGVHVHTETHDLCEETSCPVAAGDFVIAHTQTLPSFTPPVSFIIPTVFLCNVNQIHFTNSNLSHMQDDKFCVKALNSNFFSSSVNC